MVFSSVTFLFYFLPLFLLLYGLLPWRNVILLMASLVFYSWGEPQNLPLLLVCIVVNYGFGLWIGHAQDRHAAKHDSASVMQNDVNTRLVFALAIGFNLAGLLYYKYANFALSNWQALRAWWSAGEVVSETNTTIALPLGISFFTFTRFPIWSTFIGVRLKQSLAFSRCSLTSSCFPQLVAGPIVRFQRWRDSCTIVAGVGGVLK